MLQDNILHNAHSMRNNNKINVLHPSTSTSIHNKQNEQHQLMRYRKCWRNHTVVSHTRTKFGNKCQNLRGSKEID